MLKEDYILYAIKNELYLHRAWIVSVFGILGKNANHKVFHDSFVKTDEAGNMLCQVDDKVVTIENFKFGRPLFEINDIVKIPTHACRCIKKDVTTTYGILIVNMLTIEYPYGGLIEYVNDELSDKVLNKIATKAFEENIVTVDQHLKYENAASFLTIFALIAIPGASERSVQINPKIKTVKAQLLEKYKDRINDPVVVTEMQKVFEELDKEYLKGDTSEGFFIDPKSKVARLKFYGLIGGDTDFKDPTVFNTITNSQTDGWEVKDIVTLANKARLGSFNRGSNTALGGYAAKKTSLAVNTYTVTMVPCNTKRGLTVNINDLNKDKYVGRYFLGSDKPIVAHELNKYMGKTVVIRSPTYCNDNPMGTSVCCRCIGDTIANGKTGLTLLMTSITSSFLSLFLSLMHEQALSVSEYNFKDRIS